VTALYDYEAQDHDGLSFSMGDIIGVVQCTDNENEWWTGSSKGLQQQLLGKSCLTYVVFSY
jgi:hypothetical protein